VGSEERRNARPGGGLQAHVALQRWHSLQRYDPRPQWARDSYAGEPRELNFHYRRAVTSRALKRAMEDAGIWSECDMGEAPASRTSSLTNLEITENANRIIMKLTMLGRDWP